MSFKVDPTGRYIVVSSHGYYGANVIPKPADPATSFAYINNIKTSNIKSPTGGTLAHALGALSKMTAELSRAMSALSFPEGTSPGFFKTASVSDSAKASARAEADAASASYRLGIGRLATAKTIKSAVLVSSATTSLSEGIHSFTLTVNDKTATLNIAVNKSGANPDTEKNMLQQLARAIESADSNLDAEVIEGKRKVYSPLSDTMSEGTVQIRIQAKDTGDAADFMLSDTGAETMISDLNLDRVVLSGKKSAYTLNSMPGTSDANSISADNGSLSIQMLNPTGRTPVTITVEKGIAPLEKSITGLITSYNDYIEWLDKNTRFIDGFLKNDIVLEVAAMARDLKSIGLEVNDKGIIAVADKFSSALQTKTGAVESTLTGPEGLFTGLASKLNSISTNGVQHYARYQEEPGGAAGFSIFA